jgi:hypothetical protein
MLYQNFGVTNHPDYLPHNYLFLAARLRNKKFVTQESRSSIPEQSDGHAVIKLV